MNKFWLYNSMTVCSIVHRSLFVNVNIQMEKLSCFNSITVLEIIAKNILLRIITIKRN